MHLVVLVGGDEEVLVAAATGIARRAGIGADQEGALRVDHRLVDRLQDVGEDRADDEIDLVAVDERLHALGHGDIGLQFVIDDDDLDLAAAHAATELADRELQAVARLLTEDGSRAG
jgi:hypothetical protein